ncbi:MAG: hypothetical protein WCJ59_02695, partial [bacterium]
MNKKTTFGKKIKNVVKKITMLTGEHLNEDTMQSDNIKPIKNIIDKIEINKPIDMVPEKIVFDKIIT